MISLHDADSRLAWGRLGSERSERSELFERLGVFRWGFYRCLLRRADALFELTDAVLCGDGSVRSLVELSLAVEHRRGHGALYDAVNAGRVALGRLRNLVALQRIPRCDDGAGGQRIVLAVDVSAWPRPEAVTSRGRLLCHTNSRGRDRGNGHAVAGWQYSFVVALEPGRSSWCAPLDTWRLEPADDVTEVTAAQVRAVVTALIEAGQWTQDDPEIVLVGDSGYEGPRLAYLLADLPIRVLVRLRGDRLMRLPPPRVRTGHPNGRPMRHGATFACKDPATWPVPDHTTSTQTDRYGTAIAQAWGRLHPALVRRNSWADHEGELPILEGTIVRLRVDRLPGDRTSQGLWLWYSTTGLTTGLTAGQVDRIWQTYLRRFDLEHMFRFFKQTLGWTRPRPRDPAAADRWTWLLIAAYIQLRLARTLVADLRRPWENRPRKPDRLSPTRVRRGFRYLRPKTALPASAPKPTRPGPGRPPGTPNTRRAPRHQAGKKPKPTTTVKHQQSQTG